MTITNEQKGQYTSNQVADTLEEVIEIIKAENPTLQIGNDNDGYTDLSEADYEKTILDWAKARFEKNQKEQAKLQAKETAQAKLAALGLTVEDLTALGL
jgi:hypothetical protein